MPSRSGTFRYRKPTGPAQDQDTVNPSQLAPGLTKHSSLRLKEPRARVTGLRRQPDIRTFSAAWANDEGSHNGCFNAVASVGSLRKGLPNSRKDRVGYCGNDGRSRSLTHSARRLEALYMDFDRRRLLIRRIRQLSKLVCSTRTSWSVISHGALPSRRRRARLDLRPDGIGIDDGAATDRAYDPRREPPHPSILQLRRPRHINREGELDGDAAADPIWQACARGTRISKTTRPVALKLPLSVGSGSGCKRFASQAYSRPQTTA